LWQGNVGQSTEEAAAPGSVNAPTPQEIPESLWWYATMLVFATAVAESVLAGGYLGTQREEQ
jgi:hypothetical protein